MIEILDPRQIPDWNERVLQFSDYSVFHSRQWSEVLSDTYQYKPFYLINHDNSEYDLAIPLFSIKSIFTGKRGISLPFSDFCRPLESEKKGIDVLEELKALGKQSDWDYFELRGDGSFTKHIQPSMSYLGHRLDLIQPLDQIYRNFRSTTRRNIDKARRKKIEVHFFNDMKSVKEFYRLNCLTRRRHGLPPQPEFFFENIHQYLIRSGLGYVILASYQKHIVAGLIVLTFGKRAIYKFGASDAQYRNTNANYKLVWEVIKKCVQEKVESLHFGRTHPAAVGLLQYKQGWGCVAQPLNYYRFSFKKKDFVTIKSRETGLHSNIFRNLNLSTLKLFGNLFYRHLG